MANEFSNPALDAQAESLKLSDAVRAYLTCAAWTDGQDSKGRDRSLEFAFPAIVRAYNDIEQFRIAAMTGGDFLADVTEEQLGHDLWLTRNGHGTGFWDRDFEHGDKLTEIAHGMGECHVYAAGKKFYFE